MPFKNKEERRLYNRKWMKKSRCVNVEPSVVCDVEPSVVCDVEPTNINVEPSVVDENFNLYSDYTYLNLYLNKSKFNPYTMWIFKMRDVTTEIIIKRDLLQFKRKLALVRAEHKALSVYPLWKYDFDTTIKEINDIYVDYRLKNPQLYEQFICCN